MKHQCYRFIAKPEFNQSYLRNLDKGEICSDFWDIVAEVVKVLKYGAKG